MTKRLEQKLGSRFIVDGLIEVDPPRAEAALALRRKSSAAGSYEGTKILRSVEEFSDKVQSGAMHEPKYVSCLLFHEQVKTEYQELSLWLLHLSFAAVCLNLAILKSHSIACCQTLISSSRSR